MRRQRITESEVLSAVRSSGQGDVQGVQAVVLENDGSLSVIPRDSERGRVSGTRTDERGAGRALGLVFETRLSRVRYPTNALNNEDGREDNAMWPTATVWGNALMIAAIGSALILAAAFGRALGDSTTGRKALQWSPLVLAAIVMGYVGVGTLTAPPVPTQGCIYDSEHPSDCNEGERSAPPRVSGQEAT